MKELGETTPITRKRGRATRSVASLFVVHLDSLARDDRRACSHGQAIVRAPLTGQERSVTRGGLYATPATAPLQAHSHQLTRDGVDRVRACRRWRLGEREGSPIVRQRPRNRRMVFRFCACTAGQRAPTCGGTCSLGSPPWATEP